MNISSTIDMVKPSSTSFSNSNDATSNGGDGEFENVMKQEASSNQSSETSSSDKGQSSESSSESSSSKTEVTETEEVTDLQRELMAALYMQTTAVVVEVAETVETPLVVNTEVVEATEEAPVLDFGTLDLGEGEVSSQLGNSDGEELPETVEFTVETEETLVLDEELLLEVPEEAPEMEIPETVLEIETEQPQTEEVVDLEEAPVDLVEETPEEVVDTSNEETVAKAVVTDGDEQPVVENADAGTKVFDKMESVPVKVGEVVHSEDPDMDQQIAKIIASARENGDETVTIQLTPENLGTITIQLTQTADGILQVIMQAVDADAAKLLGSHAESIAQALMTSGSTVTVEVSSLTAEQAEQGGQEFDQQGEKQHQGEQEQEDEEQGIVTDDFMQQLRLGLLQFSDD